MRTEPRTFADGSGGNVSGVVAYPDGLRQALSVVLAHGAGSTMHTPLLLFLEERLTGAGYPTVRFNFPYTEQGRRIPDRAPVLEGCFRAVLATLRDELGMARLVIGGRSMGGRMATHLAAAGDAVDGLILLGYPLHPARRPDKLRIAHLPSISAPMLFVTGTRDELCTLDLLRDTITPLRAPIRLHVIEDGDHSFRSPADIQDEIAVTTIDWLAQLSR